MKTGLMKLAWIRDAGYPAGVTAPGGFNCPCGKHIPCKYGQAEHVRCSCGMVYDGQGWIVKVEEQPVAGIWTITKDLVTGPGQKGNAVGVCGPSECTLSSAQIRAHKKSRFFQLFDADENLYYEGYCVLPDGLTEDAFHPLDNFGMPNAGATSIKYRNVAGLMETL